MRRLAFSSVPIALLASACSSGTASGTTTLLATTTTVGAASTPGTTAGGAAITTTTTAAATSTTEPPGVPAPDFTLALEQGGVFTLSAEERPVLLMFWAEWCGICEREMPVLGAVAADYQGEVVFVAVAGRSTLEASAPRVGEWFSPDRMLWGYDEGLWGLFGILGQPTTVLITGADRIVGGWAGPRWADEIRAELDGLIALNG